METTKITRAYAVLHIPPKGDRRVLTTDLQASTVCLPSSSSHQDQSPAVFAFDRVIPERETDGRSGEQQIAEASVAEAVDGRGVVVLSIGGEGSAGWLFGREGNRSRSGFLRLVAIRAMDSISAARGIPANSAAKPSSSVASAFPPPTLFTLQAFEICEPVTAFSLFLSRAFGLTHTHKKKCLRPHALTKTTTRSSTS